MGLNDTVSAERLHIGFFGRRNAGKSSLVNAVTGQSLSVVSEVKGTTTDPVKKAMELLPLGPVVIIDTPGLDDEGELGELRVQKARAALAATDIAVLVIDASVGMSREDKALADELKARGKPFITAYNKADLKKNRESLPDGSVYVSAVSGEGVEELKNMLGSFAGTVKKASPLVSDLLSEGDIVILVTPIDESAPKGRIILPQQMVLRDALDSHAIAMVCQPSELPSLLRSLNKEPRLVVTDSQVFSKVASDTPENIPLTSFSILMARYKGELSELTRGFAALGSLSDGDKVLISEGCTHHRQCNDIGTVKIPGWIKNYTKASLDFSFTSGGHFPSNLSDYKLIVHCGGCMLNEAEMKHRTEKARAAGVPIVNYGVLIAGMNGILVRSLKPLGERYSLT